MKSLIRNIVLLFVLLACVLPAGEAVAQQSPDVGAPSKGKDAAHPALRGFAEFGMGALFGTLAGGTVLMTGLLMAPEDFRPVLISSAILYPAGIGAGAILGGYLTDTRSSYWEPFVGAFVGAAIADITAYFLANDYPVLSAALVIALPLVTMLIAMETSHELRGHEDPVRKARRLQEDALGMDAAVMPLSFGFGF